MSYLTVNGIAVGVPIGGASKNRDVQGVGIDRAQDGSARNNFNAKKWRLRGRTTPLTQTEGQFIRALMDGLGDHWNFDTDLYSDKGSLATGGGTRITAAPTPKYGAGELAIGAAVTQTFTCDSVADGWTLLVWSYESAAWHHYVGYGASGAAGTWIRDGSATTTPTWWTTGAAGTQFTIDLSGAGATGYFDDLVIVPAQCSASQASSLYTFCASQAWPSPYPSLKCGGDFHPVALTMMGQPGEAAVQEVFLSGALQDNAVELAFDLLEA